MIKDPYILLSYVNTKLRDVYRSPDDFFEEEDPDSFPRTETLELLKSIGYAYDAASNSFIPGGR